MAPRTRHLLVFTRWPKRGAGKRRLARDVGAATAVWFQRRILQETLRSVGGDQRWRTWLAVTLDRDAHWPKRFPLLTQPSGDLGRRMAAVALGPPPGPVVIIGSDIPGIRPRHIQAAFRALGNHDAVFGPAADGGYWLIGFKRFPRLPIPFTGVRWSTEHALADTLANLAGHRVALVDQLDDVDDGRDFRAWSRRAGHERGEARPSAD